MMNSSSKEKSPGKSKFLTDWTSTVYFDPKAENTTADSYTITHEELTETFSNLVDVRSKIDHIVVYQVPLFPAQIIGGVFHHDFVLFKTKKYWWTIEKNSECITIQRSKKRTYVKDRFRQVDRNTGITKVVSDSGTSCVDELITWLYKENELNKPYNPRRQNCKHFAQSVFNYVARSKRLSDFNSMTRTLWESFISLVTLIVWLRNNINITV